MNDRIAEPGGAIAELRGGEQVRAGSRALSVFSYSLNATVLRAHATRPLSSSALERAIPWAPQSSLRTAVGNMCDLGVLHRPDVDGGTRAPTALTEAGCELLPVAGVLEAWLKHAPGGPIEFESPAARGTIRILTAGWDSTMVRTLAERPLTLTEMNAGIPYVSYPALKRRLSKLRSTQLVVPARSGKAAAYAASDWLRRSVVPLATAGRWELMHDPEAEPITRLEVEAAFLLTLPLVELPDGKSGTCNLIVVTSPDPDQSSLDLAGVRVEVENGELVSRSLDAARKPSSWALGTPEAWLEAVIRGRYGQLRVDGCDRELTRSIVEGIHTSLFREPA